MEIIICTPSNQNTTREREAAIDELISDLYSLKIPIRTSYGEQAPGRAASHGGRFCISISQAGESML